MLLARTDDHAEQSEHTDEEGAEVYGDVVVEEHHAAEVRDVEGHAQEVDHLRGHSREEELAAGDHDEAGEAGEEGDAKRGVAKLGAAEVGEGVGRGWHLQASILRTDHAPAAIVSAVRAMRASAGGMSTPGPSAPRWASDCTPREIGFRSEMVAQAGL